MPHERPSWDEYFLDLAATVSKRATCPRKSVGVVLVRERQILATGYNGSLPHQPHCSEVGCDMEDGHCVRTVHAESNAVFQAAKHGTLLNGCHAYVTASPCWKCFQALASAGCWAITYREFYRDERIFKAAERSKIVLQHLPLPAP